MSSQPNSGPEPVSSVSDVEPGSSRDTFAIAADPATTEVQWHEQVYRGDTVPQLTWRAVLTGGVIGMAMSAANLYTVVKIGWSFGVAITSVVISFTLWNLLRLFTAGRVSPMSVLENNCMASTASSAGAATGNTIATAFGALLLIQGYHQPWWAVAGFTLFTAALGVFIAVPMKRQLINREKLAFPSGVAAATTLRSLYSHGADAVRKAYVLLAGFIAGILSGLLKAPEGAIKAFDHFFQRVPIRLPDLLPAGGYWSLNGRSMLGFGFEPSLLLIGAGMIVGLRVSLSMFAGAALLYFWIGPALAAMDLAHAGETAYLVSIPIVGGDTIYHFPRWALWGGTSVMVFSSLAAFALQWQTIARAFSGLRRKAAVSDAEARLTAINVPVSWLVAGLIPISLGMLTVQYFAFGLSPWLGLVAIAASMVLSMVAARATGETDTTPIGAMGKVMQLLFAAFSPGNIPHNLMSAGCAANAASASADLLTDLKSGYMLGANPRKQFIAQFVGIFFGTVSVVPAWYLMIPNKETLESYSPPATNMWRAVAEVLAGGGIDQLPMSARWAIVIGALVGVAIPLASRLAPRLAPFIPSAMGLGLSWVMQFKDAQAFLIGAILVLVWRRLSARTADGYSIPVASGLIAGESLAAAGVAIAATLIGWFSL
ncbi:MAG: OPT/YSL family transporter [Opitutaceae bacterium]|nr:OPT/YSL family transporter [Opitutaceae bacterium]